MVARQTDHLPAPHEPAPDIVEPEVIEPEIVGSEPKPPLWRHFLQRAAFSILLGVAGLALTLVGTILTLTIFGAFIGIPLMILGLLVLIAALFLPLARGRIKVVSLRWPPR